jgi:hypothetical protein
VTVAKFLNGIELDGFSPFALLAKASILLEHIIAFSQQTPGSMKSIVWNIELTIGV